jgi:predicted nucleic acid-binding Zn finger protein
MEFAHRYAGTSEVANGDATTAMTLQPDALRPPTYFRGTVTEQVAFREAMSALHDVVIADLRFVPKDRTAYLAWRATQDDVDLVAAAKKRGQLATEIAEVQAEVAQLERARDAASAPFFKARARYYDYLYQRDRELWFKLDPVITVHPDQVFFECFSRDESSYGRLAASYDVFDQLGERACGTTNIDYSDKLYAEFQKIRSYKATSLAVDPTGFDVRTSGEDTFREVKIDVPDSWVRGFLQVSAAATLPAAVVDLHPMDVHNVLLRLRRNKELFGPRSLRWRLRPGEPVEIVVEPWGHVVRCPRSTYRGERATEIRTWGRRRLLVLERLLARARGVRVHLLGSGQPSFYVVDLGGLSFTLGLSGWSLNNWSQAANFDLMAAREDVDDVTRARVYDQLGTSWRAGTAELASALRLDPPVVASALAGWVQAGRAIFDLEHGVWRKRELARDPLPIEQLRFSSPREAEAATLLHRAKIAVDRADDADGGLRLAGRLQDRRTVFTAAITFDVERRIVDADCSCDYFVRHRLYKGPCSHMLALRAAHRRGINDKVDGGTIAGDFKQLFREAVMRAANFQRQGKSGECIRELQRAARAMPAGSQELGQVQEVLGESLVAVNEWAEALRAADAALTLRAKSALALRVRRQALIGLGRTPEAIVAGRQLVEVDDHAERWSEVVALCLQHGDVTQAGELCDRALARHPGDVGLTQRQRQIQAVQARLRPPASAAAASAPVADEPGPKKPGFWRRVASVFTGKGAAPADPLERKLAAAVDELAERTAIADRGALVTQLLIAHASETHANGQLAAMTAAAKAALGGAVADQEIIKALRRALG